MFAVNDTEKSVPNLSPPTCTRPVAYVVSAMLGHGAGCGAAPLVGSAPPAVQ